MAVIIGNLVRDPEMRYTPGGHAVTSFSVATNRSWVSDGTEKEEVEFHNVVAWNKLAELCSQLLSKGRKVYIQGRLQTRSWDDQNGNKRYRTEIVAEDMVILDSRRDKIEGTVDVPKESVVGQAEVPPVVSSLEEKVDAEEIPF